MPQGTAIVTGAPRRIGRSLALAAAGCGYDVLIHHRHAEADAESLAGEISALGRRAAIFASDLADPTAPDAIMTEAEKLGPVTLLVNNASLFEEDSLASLTRASWDEHMAVNLRCPLLLTQAMANALPPGQSGLVVNILDQRVLHPGPEFFSYTLAKTALWTATQMAAKALAPRIRVNGIGPGPTLASIHQSPADFAAEVAATPLARAVDPEDIAGALRYLIGAPAVTGQMIAVDAGQHLMP
jgi:NAD(P)-dependent dehydrogenase (short-subunit alcohol dehydrogenase family)